MIVLMYGEGRQAANWQVSERVGPGYSRVYFINGGASYYSDAHGRRALRKGCLYVFPAHAPFEISTDPSDPIDCLFLHMDVFPCIAASLTEIDPAKEASFVPILETLRCEIRFQQSLPEADQELHYLIALTQSLFCLLRREKKLCTAGEGIEAILQYIDQHFSQPLTIAQISRNFGYTPEHFSRNFSNALGMSPYQYLLAHRMNRAIEMLRSSMPIAEIALAEGYSDARSFSHAFHRRYGMGPQQFRRHFMIRA